MARGLDAVLVRCTGDQTIVREGFQVARCLRDAGYAAEIDLGGQTLAGFGWAVDVQGRRPRFVVTDLASQTRTEVETADQVLALLR